MPTPPRTVTERLRVWGEALTNLATEENTEQLIRLLNDGDRRGLERLVGRGLIAQGGCISVVDTLTRVVNGGWRGQERCEVIPRLRPPNPSTTSGRFYRLDTGRYVFFSEADWWAHYDRASQDRAWLAENRALLVALGIVACHIELVANDTIVTVDRSRTLCFQDVRSPWDAESE